MIKIIKISSRLSDEIESILTSGNFGWYYSNSTVTKDYLYKTKNTVDSFQFIHLFADNFKINSNYFGIIEKLIEETKIKIKRLRRAKANLNVLNPKQNLKQYQPPHTDVDEPNWYSLLYYVNDSDGDTLFFNKNNKIIKKIKPKKGKAILFKSNILHAAQNPKKSLKRIVINIIFS